ncbi:MAG: hypothetical protein AB1330_01375 [Bacillota bacterium]
MSVRNLANRAINALVIGYRPDAVSRAFLADGILALRRGHYRSAASFLGEGFGSYMWTNASPGQRVARIAGAWAALDVITRMRNSGSLVRDRYGRFNIAGVPFI